MVIHKFKNDEGVPEIGIGTRVFECIGESPPMDHPWIYLDMGEKPSILCPYCATKYTYLPHLGQQETDPPGNFIKTMDE